MPELRANFNHRGSILTIEASGNFSERIEKGSYVDLTVKYGLIRLISTKEDLCDQLKNVDKECPIEKGKTTVKKEVELPKQIPPVSKSSISSIHLVPGRANS